MIYKAESLDNINLKEKSISENKNQFPCEFETVANKRILSIKFTEFSSLEIEVRYNLEWRKNCSQAKLTLQGCCLLLL